MITVGVLTPHAAQGAELELPLMAPQYVRTVVSHIPAGGSDEIPRAAPPVSADQLRALAGQSDLDEATAALPAASVDVIGYASTSTAYALGLDAESLLVERLSKRWGLPAFSSSKSAVEALRSFQIRRVALVHPPWFGDALNMLGADYFSSQGFDVVGSSLADVEHDPDLVTPSSIVGWLLHHLPKEAEAVFLGGNGFRAAGAIGELENRLGCLVLEANQVLLWSILVNSGTSWDIPGFGMVLEKTQPRQ